MYHFNKLSIFFAILFVLSGCTNLSAVKQYSKAAELSLDKVPVVVADFSLSCHRRAQYQPISNQPDCAKLDKVEYSLTRVISVLQKYIISLGKLASDDVVVFTEDFNKLKKEINGLKRFNKNEVTAVSGVAKYLTRLATDKLRRNAVKDTIKDNNKNILFITNSIGNIILNDYKNLLELEKIAIAKHYNGLRARYRKSEPLAVMMLMKEKNIKILKMDEKIKTIEPLAILIKKVGAGHNGLAVQMNKLDYEGIAKVVKSYVSDVKPIIKQVRDVYK